MTAEQIKKGVDYLESVRKDYQFDPESPDYVGFLNVGIDIIDDSVKESFTIVCEHPEFFERVMAEMGIFTEEGIHLSETIFYMLDK